MKHNPRRMRWTKAWRRAHGKEMVLDSTFNFEKKRMTPVKYNRNLMVKTIQAMQVVDRIKHVRQERFHKQRLAKQFRLQQSSAQKEAVKGMNLLEGPAKNTALKYQKEIEAKGKVKRKAKVKVESNVAGSSSTMEVEG
eukprot:CAMPEP_0179236168 /NCGR_PEP_ID=MMETSP0797-20121207/13788_1 /TAXON_ID=47934 /ORGANISM="Dinophysis acuminata, Strain DAEP01" /LENGTH=137 /DNA_ID=CAMNT_0020943415 /DNA_START=204 /DNA_END=617 /DNA_ORIENTATION=-